MLLFGLVKPLQDHHNLFRHEICIISLDEVTTAFRNNRPSAPFLFRQFGKSLIVLEPVPVDVFLDKCLWKGEAFL